MSRTVKPLLDFNPSDPLGRRVFSAKEAKRAEERGKIIPHRFFPPKNQDGERESCISTDRLGIEPDTNMTTLVKDTDERGDKFEGWACVTKEQASGNGRLVKVTPAEKNPYHADICFPDAVIKNDTKLREAANDLAACAVWRKKSEKS